MFNEHSSCVIQNHHLQWTFIIFNTRSIIFEWKTHHSSDSLPVERFNVIRYLDLFQRTFFNGKLSFSEKTFSIISVCSIESSGEIRYLHVYIKISYIYLYILCCNSQYAKHPVFEYRIHHFKYRIHHFKYRIHHFKYKVHHFKYKFIILNTKFIILNTKHAHIPIIDRCRKP